MAVKMRLMRMGKKHSPFYRVVVIDGRAPRDGRYIDLLGRYDPRQEPSLIEIDSDKAIDWLKKGAQPTEAVRKLLEISGAMSRYKVAAGKIHTVTAKAPVAAQPAAETETAEAPAEETEAAEAPAEKVAAQAPAEEDAPVTEAAEAEPTEAEAESDTAEDSEEE